MLANGCFLVSAFVRCFQVFSFFRYHPEIRFSSEFWYDVWREDSGSAAVLQETLLLVRVDSAALLCSPTLADPVYASIACEFTSYDHGSMLQGRGPVCAQ